MADVFDEVDGQLRSARYTDMARRGWPYAAAVAGAALLVALGVWGFDAYARSRDAAASRDYAAALTALGRQDAKGADALFGKVVGEGGGGYKALALMQQAGLRLQSAKPDEAVALLDRAAHADRDPAVSDAAALKAALIAMDHAPLAQTQSRLEPLLASGRPYREMAREALAMARIAAGRGAEATGDLQLLALQQDVSDSARVRAQASSAMIDSGAIAVVPQIVKAQAALPPQPFSPPQAAPPQPSSAPGAGAAGQP